MWQKKKRGNIYRWVIMNGYGGGVSRRQGEIEGEMTKEEKELLRKA